jgi:hypothetical protein
MNPHAIDLSALDPEQRERWEGRLNQLPAGIRDTLKKNLGGIPADRVAKILRDNEPMISRLEAKAGHVVGKGADLRANLPHVIQLFGTKSHYNHTVQRGDGHGVRLVPLVALAVAFALVVTWVLQQVAG